MPFKSEKQRRWMYANKPEMAKRWQKEEKRSNGKKKSAAVDDGFSRLLDKIAGRKRDMPSFTEQDRPKKVKEIYRALKRDHPNMPAEMKARIAARQGKPGKQKQGPPYKGPIKPWPSKKTSTVDRFLSMVMGHGEPVEDHMGRVLEKAAFTSRLIESPVGRYALRHGIPAIGGGAAGYSMAPPDQKAKGTVIGSLAGLGGGIAARKGLKALKAAGLSKALKDLEPVLSKDIYGKLTGAVERMKSGLTLSPEQAKLVSEHLSAHFLPRAVAGAGAGYGAGYLASKANERFGGGGGPFSAKYGEFTPHWRKLPSGWTGKDKSGEPVKGKTWVDKEESSYLQQMKGIAGPTAVRALADVPKGALEKTLETKALGGKVNKELVGKALKSGVGRYAGATTVGIATAPLFVSGVRQMSSDDKKERQKGVAKVLGSGVLFQVAKGGGQKAAEEMRQIVRGGRQVAEHKLPLRKILSAGGARAVVSIPSSLGAAFGVARSREEKSSPLRTALYGAAGGAAGGALKGAVEIPVEMLLAGKINRQGLARKMVSRGLARGATGALGGAALGALFKWMSNAAKG